MKLRAWRNAIVSGDCCVAVAFLALAMILPQAVPQRKRAAPVETISGAEIRSPLLLHDFARHQIVPSSVLVVVCTLVPLAAQILLSIVGDDDDDNKGVAARLYSLAYACGSTIASIDVLKRYCGYWRPYAYDEGGDDAYRSFPSGHAALSFVALGHTSLCLLGSARCGRPDKRRLGPASIDVGPLKLTLCLGPTYLAGWIAATRVVEADHHPADILAGACIGFSFASLFYFRYFPSIFALDANLPRHAFIEDGVLLDDDRTLLAADASPPADTHAQSAGHVAIV
ncbi:hypothetical protein CTAYLR_002637 [Chrysophaeum taylorii]|uniref:Phosphatidic acid phosphatase type 2/haloperoxidase domain-containing protein n=1 Tax=Chrysophaeum taylorii TaxID=2483200 RepID=A0AAD7UDR8_9STRA|nr:hypothetical protein CTAYLR_002637 [Chrysophaeum taylorii]